MLILLKVGLRGEEMGPPLSPKIQSYRYDPLALEPVFHIQKIFLALAKNRHGVKIVFLSSLMYQDFTM